MDNGDLLLLAVADVTVFDKVVSSHSKAPARTISEPLFITAVWPSWGGKPARSSSPRPNPLVAARHRDHLGLTKLRQLRSPNGSSPPIWWRTRARAGASATASWAARRRTAATSSGGDHPVINRRMNMGGAMVLGRGRRRESGAENDCNRNCKFCLAQHFLSPGRASRLYLPVCDQHWASRQIKLMYAPTHRTRQCT
jgi:hypothetical protein